MKRILFLITVFTAFVITSHAQMQIDYSVKAGLNLSKFSSSKLSKNAKEDYYILPSFHVGGFVETPIYRNLYLQSGLSIQGKGERSLVEEDQLVLRERINIYTVELPVNAIYYLPTGKYGDVFVGIGGYIGYAVAGQFHWEQKLSGVNNSGNRNLEFTGNEKDFNPFDIGANFSIGFKLFNGFLLHADYALGLNNISKTSIDAECISHRVFRFGIGKQF